MSTPAYTTFVGGVAGQALNEAAFRHFLHIERQRAERAAQAVLLVLVSLRTGSGRNPTLGTARASAVFSALGECVRESDFVGWYREGRVAGAVLTHQPASLEDICPRVTIRVTSALRRQRFGVSASFRVWAVPLRGRTRGPSDSHSPVW